MANYLDTSALVKLVVRETESTALQKWLNEQPAPNVTSDLARTELMRATRRSAPALVMRARQVLDALSITQLGTSAFEAAGRLEPTTMRSLDALHLAAALELGDDLDTLVTYNTRLAAAATLNGITAVAPT